MSQAEGVQRVLDPSYVDRLGSLPPEELRRRRRECEGVESELSMRRSMLHGLIDLLRAEVQRRGTMEGSLLDGLGSALARPRLPGRGARPKMPSVAQWGDDPAAELLSEGLLARLPELSDDEIAGHVERVLDAERQVSELRKRIQHVLDAIIDALVDAYADGRASPMDVLGGVAAWERADEPPTGAT